MTASPQPRALRINVPATLIDPLTQIAFSLFENRNVFALLLGSGLSRPAQIMTGWEITLDLVKRIACVEGITDHADWGAWYYEKHGQEPNYSTLIEELAATPAERRAILNRYIEPSEDDLANGRKAPTAAHRAIAKLVASGYIRVIITTNFDRLLEIALAELGIQPTIVSSPDALLGAEPFAHSKCYLLKLHGDYRDTRIRNTEAELHGYPPEYDQLLDRLLDEHGLIISGWSGQWDHALRASLRRAPNRRYSTFWTTLGTLADGARELVEHRKAHVVTVASADGFFAGLEERVATLEASHRENPRSVDLLVERTKRLLSKAEYRIQLDELITEETRRLLTTLDSADLGPPATWDVTTLRVYVERYTAATERLACVCGVLGKWAGEEQLSAVIDVLKTMYAQARKHRAGFAEYINLRDYPAVLVLAAYGLALTRAGQWSALHRLFSTVVAREEKHDIRIADALVRNFHGNLGDLFRKIEGYENHKTALSQQLFQLFSEWGTRFVGLTADFELLFSRFEWLAALACYETFAEKALEQAMQGEPYGTWVPIGRGGWERRLCQVLPLELQAEPLKTELLAAGFANGVRTFFDLSLGNVRRLADVMRW